MAENVGRGSLLDAALSQGGPKRAECGVPRTLRQHPERRAEIEELIAATPHTVSYVIASKTMAAEGIQISTSTLSRHARGVCACPS